MSSRRALIGALALALTAACTSSEPEPSPPSSSVAPVPAAGGVVVEDTAPDEPDEPEQPQRAPTMTPPEPGPDPWLGPGEQPWRTCAGRPCRAGRYTVESIEDEVATVRVVEVLASSEHHPNGTALSGTFELLDEQHRLEAGKTYALILAQHGMQYFEPVFVAGDDDQGMAEMAAIHCSPHAYENSLAWQTRRRTWRGLHQRLELGDSLFGATITAWAESDDQRTIAFIIGGSAWFVYDDETGRISARRLADDPTNITYEDGHFVLWDENRRLLTNSALPLRVPTDTRRIDVEPSALTMLPHRTPDECAAQMCYGGVFVVDGNSGPEGWVSVRGHFTEVVPSCAGHPNGTPPDTLSFLSDQEHEPGDTLVALVSQGSSRQPASLVATAPATSTAALEEVRAILSHEAAFQNGPDDRKLHALFDSYRRARDPDAGDGTIGVWATDPEYQHLVTPGWSYDRRRGSVSVHMFQKSSPPGYNRVTYDERWYTLWYNSDAYMHLGV